LATVRLVSPVVEELYFRGILVVLIGVLR